MSAGLTAGMWATWSSAFGSSRQNSSHLHKAASHSPCDPIFHRHKHGFCSAGGGDEDEQKEEMGRR